MRLIRNEFGQMVPDKPSYIELEKALDRACLELRKLDQMIDSADYMDESKWKNYLLEVIEDDMQ